MTRRPNFELFQHGAAHSRKASAEPHWENESSGHSVIWSASSLAKFIRHPTTAIGQLTFGSRDRPVSRVSNRQAIDRRHSCETGVRPFVSPQAEILPSGSALRRRRARPAYYSRLQLSASCEMLRSPSRFFTVTGGAMKSKVLGLAGIAVAMYAIPAVAH